MPRIDKQSDHAGHSFGVGWRLPGRRELGGDLFPRQSGRQLSRRKIGSDQIECVMMRRLIGRRARAGVERHALGAVAADELVGLLAHVAFGKAGHGRGNAVGHPVINAGTAAAFGVDHQKTKVVVPSGTLLQENCGETLSPTQFGLLLPFALVLATFFGIILPSAKVVDLSVTTSAASAAAAVKPTATAAVATTKIDFLIMVIPLCFRGAQAAG